MKTWTLLIRKVDKPIFERIKNKEKTIETRALNAPNSKKGYYGSIAVRDKIIFKCDGEKLEKTVTAVRKYISFNEYLKNEDLQNILGPGTTLESAKNIHFSFPGYEERLEKYGIVVFDID